MAGDGLQAALQDLAGELVASGAEVGLQAAVWHRGRLAASVAAGTADPRTGVPVTEDTLFFAASTAKAVASSVAHVLAERGLVGYDMPVASVWPEFGRDGKDVVTLRHVLNHTAGLPGLPPGVTVAELCDWELMCALLARGELWWEPGTRFGYHAKTFGFLLGETLRRATGRTISELLGDLITGPLGVRDDVHFGVPEPLLPRVAWQVPAVEPAPEPEPGSAADRALPAGIRPDARYANRRDALTADIPSDGTMTALGAARILAALLDGAEGTGLVSPGRLAAMAAITFTGRDEVMGTESSWAFGYAPGSPGAPSRPGSVFGMAGMNGSAAWADIDSGTAVAVMRNHFGAGGFATAERIGRLAVRCLPGTEDR